MKKKVGEIFSETRELSSGTGYSYYLTQLTGGLALIDSIVNSQSLMKGGIITQKFTFCCIEPGEASYQFAKFRIFDPSDALYEDVIQIDIESIDKNSANSPGGWSDLHKPDENELQIFQEAFEGFVGVSYTPIVVRSQIVNGTNYNFATDAVGIYPGAVPYKAQVSIHKPINGKAVITNIVRLLGDNY